MTHSKLKQKLTGLLMIYEVTQKDRSLSGYNPLMRAALNGVFSLGEQTAEIGEKETFLRRWKRIRTYNKHG